jgi:hypothetical protein
MDGLHGSGAGFDTVARTGFGRGAVRFAIGGPRSVNLRPPKRKVPMNVESNKRHAA